MSREKENTLQTDAKRAQIPPPPPHITHASANGHGFVYNKRRLEERRSYAYDMDQAGYSVQEIAGAMELTELRIRQMIKREHRYRIEGR